MKCNVTFRVVEYHSVVQVGRQMSNRICCRRRDKQNLGRKTFQTNRGTICSLTVVLTFITKQIMATKVQMHQSHHAEHGEMGSLCPNQNVFLCPVPPFSTLPILL